MAMQDFIRRKNIENLKKQLASGQLDEAQQRYARQKLAELAAQQNAVHAREQSSWRDVAPKVGGRSSGPEFP